jgi:hypothetical protein
MVSPLNILFYVDSGAGQSMCSCPDAFLSLRPCAIEVVGVSGSLPIFGVGTAMFVVTAVSNLPVTILIHDCLLSQGSPFNLLSVSQFQASGRHTVDFSVDGPSLRVRTRGHTSTRSIRSSQATTTIPLVACDGLYGFYAEPLHPNDNRYSSLPRFHLTTRSEDGASSDALSRATGVATRTATVRFEPRGFTGIVSSWACDLDDEDPASKAASRPSGLDTGVLSSTATPLGHWSCKLLVSSSNTRRILAFPSGASLDFDSELRAFCDGFLSPVTIPPARRTYDPGNPTHMADLSARFMGAGDERLRRTIELNRGLTPTSGRVPTHLFPQGKFKQGKTPRVSKGKVHHLHRASICEVLFTDTFETGDSKYRYGQAFVDYRSRWGDVIPLRSRTQVGWAFDEFAAGITPRFSSSTTTLVRMWAGL